jgi:hypothetical protein
VKLLPIVALLLPAAAFPFAEQPWLGNVWEFNFSTDFTYSRYRNVQDASTQLRAPSNDKLLQFDLGLTPSEMWDVQVEMQFADTPRQSLGMRSAALQGRVLWLDDVAGDPLSWTTGVSVREVTRHSLQDVSCPYHSDVNVELNSAFGKEWSKGAFWTIHAWGLVGAGIANHGSPWLRALAVLEKNWNNSHRAALFTEGYFGFGDKHHIDVDHFSGWGKFHHQSIDLGIAYRYHFAIWGEITAAYTRRVFARTFPQDVNFFTIAYQVPFSFF